MSCDAMAWPARSERRCDGCGAPLTGRQQRWCGGGCDELYWTNHRFNRARETAKARCVVRVRVVHRYYTDGTVSHTWTVPTHWRCARCGCHTTNPEVNHIIQAMGAHAAESCIHHQENLEVLCHECHDAVTRSQRSSRPLQPELQEAS